MARPCSFTPIDKQCLHCGKWWHAAAWYAVKKQKYCSRACQGLAAHDRRWVERTKRDCKKCGKGMELVPHQLKTKWFCSYSCSNGYKNSGSGNPAWKGGDVLGKYWKRKCRERDNHTCQFPKCGKRGKGISGVHAHHKVPRKTGGEDTLDNLISLCNRHHREMERQLLARLIERVPEIVQEVASQLYPW